MRSSLLGRDLINSKTRLAASTSAAAAAAAAAAATAPFVRKADVVAIGCIVVGRSRSKSMQLDEKYHFQDFWTLETKPDAQYREYPARQARVATNQPMGSLS